MENSLDSVQNNNINNNNINNNNNNMYVDPYVVEM